MKILLLLIVLFPSVFCRSQNCNTYNVKPKAGQYGYQERLGDARCEGLFTENVSGITLDVLSLTYGQLHYKLYEDERLIIKAPNVKGTKSFNIRGINFGMYDSYRLDFSLDTNKEKKIPVKDVLMPNKIGEKNLGIYGYSQTPGKGIVYIPAYVHSIAYRNIIQDPKNIYLKLLTNTILQEVEWRYAAYENGKCGSYSTSTKIAGTFTSQLPITIILKKEMLNTDICIEIRYKTASGEFNSKNFNIIVAH